MMSFRAFALCRAGLLQARFPKAPFFYLIFLLRGGPACPARFTCWAFFFVVGDPAYKNGWSKKYVFFLLRVLFFYLLANLRDSNKNGKSGFF